MPVMKADGRRVRWHCPGCGCEHLVPVSGPGAWSFNGDLEHPSLDPSVLVHSHTTLINPDLVGDALTASSNVTVTPQCHAFIRDGMIHYLPDCTHALAGTLVTMEGLS